MHTLAWDHRFTTGLPALDGEHKLLFRDVRRIQGFLEPGGDFPKGRRHLEALMVRLEIHCASEEAEMARLGFPGLAAHRASHQVLHQRLDGIRALVAEGRGTSGMAVSRLLYDWLRDHMLQEDLTFAAFLRNRAPQEA